MLDEKNNPIPAGDTLEYAEWVKTYDRCVEKTVTPSGYCVSTVFLGMDHQMSWGDAAGPPVLWETMVFGPGGTGDDDMNRYISWKEAVRGHWRMVKKFGGAKPQKLWEKMVYLFTKGVGREIGKTLI